MIKKIFFIFIFYLLSISYSFSENNIYILTTVDDKIITNYDIQKESEYLKILNPSLSQLDGKKIFKISKESLVNRSVNQHRSSQNNLAKWRTPKAQPSGRTLFWPVFKRNHG